MSTDLIIEHLDLWTSAVTYNNGKGRGNNGEPELTGIQKLRELILELAVRGKLVPQDPEDEPASKLLERIEEEKARLYKEGKIKKPKKLPEVTEEEKPFDLPDNWSFLRLGMLAQIIRGVSYKKHDTSKTLQEGFRPLLRANNIQSIITQDSLVYVPENFVKPEQIVKSGDILIAMSSGSSDLVGKAAQANYDLNQTFGAFCAVIRAFDSSIHNFLGWYTKTPMYREQTQVAGRGIGINNLNKKALEQTLVAVPPLNEQIRIVHKLQELMGLCDRLEQQTSDQLSAHETLVDTLLDTLTRSQNAAELADNWVRLAEHFDTLFTTEHSIDRLEQTILQLAVMGRLVPQDSDDEPASKLLERIAEKKQGQGSRKGKGNKYKNASDKFKPYQLPAGWEWCHFDDIGVLSRGKSKHRPRNDPWLFRDGFMPLVQTGDIAKPGRKIDTFTYLYNANGVAQSLVWPQGTLCITIAANIGETGILDFEACFPDSVVGFIPYDSAIKNEYIEYFLRTAQKSLEDFAPATAQKNINLNILQNLLIPLPPISELNRIIDRVDELMALCDRLKACLKEAEEIQSELTESFVKLAVT